MKKKKVRASSGAQLQRKKKGRANGEEEAFGFDSLCDFLVANIFGRLTLKEKLATIPTVCRRWNRVSRDALCWQSIDLDVWAEHRLKLIFYVELIPILERMVEMLVTRSDGCLLSFASFCVATDSTLRLVAQRGQALQRLLLPVCAITDECVREVAPLLPSITHLDIRCHLLSQTTLEAFGQHCKCLVNLAVCVKNEEQCLAIAQHMPQLKHLRLFSESTKGLQAIVDSCTALQVLELTARPIDMDEALLEKYKRRNIKVVLDFTTSSWAEMMSWKM